MKKKLSEEEQFKEFESEMRELSLEEDNHTIVITEDVAKESREFIRQLFEKAYKITGSDLVKLDEKSEVSKEIQDKIKKIVSELRYPVQREPRAIMSTDMLNEFKKHPNVEVKNGRIKWVEK